METFDHQRTLRLTGGALEALDVVLDGQLMAGNLTGGTHHAFKAKEPDIAFLMTAICAEKHRILRSNGF